MNAIKERLTKVEIDRVFILSEARLPFDLSCQMLRQCDNNSSSLVESRLIQTEYPVAVKSENNFGVFSGWKELQDAAHCGRDTIELICFSDLPTTTAHFHAWKYLYRDVVSQLKNNTYLAQLNKFMEACPAEVRCQLTSAEGKTPLALAYNLANADYKSAMRHVRNLKLYRNAAIGRLQNDCSNIS